MARKTIEVEVVKARANRALNLEVEGNTPDFRRGVIAVLEDVLERTGNYRGFQFTDYKREHTPEGYLVEGSYDDTRRTYC